jgi:hypothetical protein
MGILRLGPCSAVRTIIKTIYVASPAGSHSEGGIETNPCASWVLARRNAAH